MCDRLARIDGTYKSEVITNKLYWWEKSGVRPPALALGG